LCLAGFALSPRRRVRSVNAKLVKLRDRIAIPETQQYDYRSPPRDAVREVLVVWLGLAVGSVPPPARVFGAKPPCADCSSSAAVISGCAVKMCVSFAPSPGFAFAYAGTLVWLGGGGACGTICRFVGGLGLPTGAGGYFRPAFRRDQLAPRAACAARYGMSRQEYNQKSGGKAAGQLNLPATREALHPVRH